MRVVDLTVEFDRPRDRNYKICKFKNTCTQDNKQQDACTGVHSACRREENGHNLDICVLRHRDYKRIEWASREKSRDKLNTSNGGSGIEVPGRIPSSVHLCVYRFISAFFIERCSQAIEREF